jgi:hypothetical protein
MRARDRLADVVAALLAWSARRMPPARQDWGRAVVAELAAVPPTERRLRWALGSLWFVLRCRLGRQVSEVDSGAMRAAPTWVLRVFAPVGVVTVAPWLLVTIQTLRDDAPDMARGWGWVMLGAQVALVLAFLANWWRRRAAALLLVAALAGYAAATALAAASNNGTPVLAALLFTLPPALAAVPIVLGARRGTSPAQPAARH